MDPTSQSVSEYESQRSVFRLPMNANDPVYLLLNMDGVDIDPIVDELSAGGARLVSSKHYDRFVEGQVVGPAVLVLQDVGVPVVYPIVKWKSWPVIGVEFLELSEKDQELIFRFIFKLQRKLIQPKNVKRRRR